MMSPFDDTAGMASDLRAFLRNSGWRLSQPARRASGAVRGDQGPEGLASRERSGRLNGKQECPLSERISGISVYFGNTTSRTTGCRCVVEHCAGDEERCPRRSTNPRVETMSNQTLIIIHEFFTVP